MRWVGVACVLSVACGSASNERARAAAPDTAEPSAHPESEGVPAAHGTAPATSSGTEPPQTELVDEGRSGLDVLAGTDFVTYAELGPNDRPTFGDYIAEHGDSGVTLSVRSEGNRTVVQRTTTVAGESPTVENFTWTPEQTERWVVAVREG
ncbi:MAG: hypothetical protein AAF645_15410, partial [Myxococcota bacterium]